MNKADYTMDFNERRQYAYDRAYEILEGDTDAFVEACEALDDWNGFLGEDRCYYMEEIDELLYGKKPSEIIDLMTSDFSSGDTYFYFSIYGLESCDDKYDHYSENFVVDAVLDDLIENYNHINLTENDSLNEVVSVLFNEDFGIEDGWEYDENNWEGEYYTDTPEETDDEFTDRIDSI